MKEMNEVEKRNIELMLSETLGNATPPSNAESILDAVLTARAKPLTTNTHSVSPRHKPKRNPLAIAIAAASVIIGLALMLWPSPTLPRGIVVADGTVISTDRGWLELEEGWLIASSEAGSIRADQTRLDALHGKALVRYGSIPTSQEVEAIETWLRENHLEVDMFTDSKRWLKRGALAIALISGTALVDGAPVSAESELPLETILSYDVGTPLKPVIVQTIADIESLADDVLYVKCIDVTDAHIDFLTAKTSIIALDLSNNQKLTQTCLPYLKKLSNLQSLDIRNCWCIASATGTERIELHKLEVLSEMSSLKDLKVSTVFNAFETKAKTSIKPDDLHYLLGDTANRLESFTVTYIRGWTDDDFKDLANYFPTTVEISMQGNFESTDTALKYIASMQSLRSLDLRSTSTTDAGLAYLADSSITELSKQIPEQTGHFAPLGNITSLEKLTLSTHRPSGAAAVNWRDELSTLSKLEKLRELSISGDFDDNALAALVTIPKLRTLFLKGSLNGSGFSYFHSDMPLEKLTVKSAVDLRSLDGIEKAQSLKHLVLERLYHTGDTLGAVAKLPSLETLELNSANWGNQYDPLASLSQSKTLRHLILSDTYVSSIRSLSELTSLRTIAFTYYEIRDMDAFAELLELPSVEEVSIEKLNFDYPALTFDRLKIDASSLKKLTLSKVNWRKPDTYKGTLEAFKNDEIQTLKNALPNCEVVVE